jgi:hypothetical protein
LSITLLIQLVSSGRDSASLYRGMMTEMFIGSR